MFLNGDLGGMLAGQTHPPRRSYASCRGGFAAVNGPDRRLRAAPGSESLAEAERDDAVVGEVT